MISKSKLKINKNNYLNSGELLYGIVFFLFIMLYVRKLIQFASGLQYPTWGYSTFLVNYEGGFVRRGFAGQVLLMIFKTTSLTPYISLLFLFLFLFTFIIFLWHRIIRKFDIRYRIFLLLNPAFIVMPLQQDTSLLVKEWIIGAFLLANTLIAIKVFKNEISKDFFKIYFLVFIIPITFILNLVHEEQFFLLPIYIFIYILGVNAIPIQFKDLLKNKILIFFTSTQLTALSAVIYFHGNSGQANKIYNSIPSNLHAKKYIIDSVGWTLKDSIALTLNLWKSPATIFTFLICLIIGPFAIYYIFNKLQLKFLVRDFFLISPIFSLFFVGWDWGRWIILLTFAVISLCLINSRIYTEKDLMSQKAKSMTFATLVWVLAIVFLMICLRVPNCCVQPWYGFTTFDQIVENLSALNKIFV